MKEPALYAKGILYTIACAASSGTLVPNFVREAQAMGWSVCVITTPQGTKFLDIPLLERLTGYPVRSEYKRPEEPDVLPRADAIVVFPATFNTINKWALGISDTLAVGYCVNILVYICLLWLFLVFALEAVSMVTPPSSEVFICSKTMGCVCSMNRRHIHQRTRCHQMLFLRSWMRL